MGTAAARSLVLLLVATAATAAPPSAAERDEARRQVKEAEGLFQAQSYVEAMAAFERANALVPRPSFVFMIGRCHEELGHLEEAVERFEAFLGTDAPEKRKALARGHIDDLRARMAARPATLVVRTAGRTDAAVTIDGGHVGTGETVSAKVEPGGHDVRVTAPGHEPFQRTLTVASGDTTEVLVTLMESPATLILRTSTPGVRATANGAPLPLTVGGARLKPGRYTLVVSSEGFAPVEVAVQAAAGQTVVVPVELAPIAVAGPSGLRVAAWSAAGVGAASLVAGVLLTVLSQSGYDDAAAKDDEGVATLSQVDARDAVARANRLQTGAIVAWSLSAALAATSVTLFVLDAPASSGRSSVSLRPATGGASLIVEFPL